MYSGKYSVHGMPADQENLANMIEMGSGVVAVFLILFLLIVTFNTNNERTMTERQLRVQIFGLVEACHTV